MKGQLTDSLIRHYHHDVRVRSELLDVRSEVAVADLKAVKLGCRFSEDKVLIEQSLKHPDVQIWDYMRYFRASDHTSAQLIPDYPLPAEQTNIRMFHSPATQFELLNDVRDFLESVDISLLLPCGV